MKKGATIPLIIILGAFGVWCSALSIAIFNYSGTTSGLVVSIGDIKDSIKGFPKLQSQLSDVKAEVDWLAKQKGYSQQLSDDGTTTLTSN